MKTWFTHELHPLCTLFPRMVGAEFNSLVADIAANGLQHPIVLYDDMVLDGGNRYRACEAAGVEPRFAQFTGQSVVGFVLSMNLHRRHIAQGQAAIIVASAQDWAKAQTVGNPAMTGDSQLRNVAQLVTAADRAAQSGASIRTQQTADKLAKASPEMAAKVARGEVSLTKAVEQIDALTAKPKPVAEPDDASEDHVSQMAQMLQEATDDNESMARVFESDDKLAAAMSEAKRFREQVRILESRITGLMNEKNEAVRLAKMWKGRFEKIERAHANLPA